MKNFLGDELVSYICKSCSKKRKAAATSRVYQEKLCPACLDQAGKGMYGVKGVKR